MNALIIGFAFVGGVLLGMFYFGGLWLTVHRLPRTPTAGLWLLASFALRTAVVLIGFFAISNGHWEQMVACLVGFIVARTVTVRWYGMTCLAGEASINGRATLPRSPESPLASGSAGASPSRNAGALNGNR